MKIPTAVNGASTDVLSVADLPVLWICVFGVFAVIIAQTVICVRAARKVAPSVGMTTGELKTSFRTGAVSALGPSLAVALVAIALLTVCGGPAVLVRIGLIGSVVFETGAASIAAGSMGAELGGPSYTRAVFAVAFMAMTLGGSRCMVATLVLTPLLKRGDVSLRRVRPAVMTVVPAAALLGTFFASGFAELPKSAYHVVAFVAILIALAVTYSAVGADLFPAS